MCCSEEAEQKAWPQELQLCPTRLGHVPVPSASPLLQPEGAACPVCTFPFRTVADAVGLTVPETCCWMQRECYVVRASAHRAGLCSEGEWDIQNPSSL